MTQYLLRYQIQLILLVCIKQDVTNLRKELDFFNERWPVVSKETETISPELFLSALRRLGHEVMFLTIDTFSLHKGIAGKNSLLSKEIRDKGALLYKVDNTDSISTDTFTSPRCFFLVLVEEMRQQRKSLHQ